MSPQIKKQKEKLRLKKEKEKKMISSEINNDALQADNGDNKKFFFIFLQNN